MPLKAIMRDPTKLIVLGRGVLNLSKSEIRIYSSVGENIFTINVIILLFFDPTNSQIF